MNNELTKQYYKIRDVADFLGVTQSTLRFWEKEFPEAAPKRTPANQRYYTPADIETLRIIHFLLKTRGLKIEAAKEELRKNRKNVSTRLEIIDTLSATRNELQKMLDALEKRR